MSSEEEETTAVADPPASPSEPPKPVPEAQEPESDAAAAEGEVPESESGTPTDEGDKEAPIDILASQLETLYETNPDAAERIAKGLPQKVREGLQGAGDIRAEIEAENAQGTRQGVVRSKQSLAASYNANSFFSEVQPLVDQMADAANEAAKKLDGRDEDVLDSTTWGPHVTQGLSKFIDGAKVAADSAARTELAAVMMSAFESHPSAKRLTAKDREAMNGAAGKTVNEQIAAYIHIYMDVAERNAPAAFTEKKTKELEDTLGIADVIESIAKVAGGNGRKATKAAGQPGSQPKNEQEAINWHATGKWTNAEMRAWRAKQQE